MGSACSWRGPSGPFEGTTLTLMPSGMSLPSSFSLRYSARECFVKPLRGGEEGSGRQRRGGRGRGGGAGGASRRRGGRWARVAHQLSETKTFWRPGSCTWRSASPRPAPCGCRARAREEDLADLDAGDGAVGLAEGAAHAGLQPIGAGAREHLVDAEHVPRVDAHAQVERLLAGVLHHVLVARYARRLERLGGDLLLLHRHHVDGEREVVDGDLLAARVVDADLRVCGW